MNAPLVGAAKKSDLLSEVFDRPVGPGVTPELVRCRRITVDAAAEAEIAPRLSNPVCRLVRMRHPEDLSATFDGSLANLLPRPPKRHRPTASMGFLTVWLVNVACLLLLAQRWSRQNIAQC